RDQSRSMYGEIHFWSMSPSLAPVRFLLTLSTYTMCRIDGNKGGGSHEHSHNSRTLSRRTADFAVQSADVSDRNRRYCGGGAGVAIFANPGPHSASVRRGAGAVLDGVVAA